jgi:hypothetical protein
MVLTFSFVDKVHGTRFTDKYLASRQTYSRSFYSPYSFSPPLPARSYERPTKKVTLPTPGSPQRQVVTDFAAFGARSNASVFGTAVASTPFSLAGGKAAFGGVRSGGRSMFDGEDEDEEEDKGRQRVELREDSISLDQASYSIILPRLQMSNDCHRRDVSLCRVRGGVLYNCSMPLYAAVRLTSTFHHSKTCRDSFLHKSCIYPYSLLICK